MSQQDPYRIEAGDIPRRASRRAFLKLSAATVAAAAAGTGAPKAAAARARPCAPSGRGNLFPGRIVLFHDPTMNGQGAIDHLRVEAVVHAGIRLLTGVSDTAQAFETLFPGLHSGSTIAIKINSVGTTDTRWETARGVVSGLSLMLGGTYDVGQVTIYDNRDFENQLGNPYRVSDFTFNGHHPHVDDCRDDCSAYDAYDGHCLTQYLLDCDHVINMPALKSHDRPLNQMSLAFKNHYGSCCPPDLCDDIPGMLTVNADPHIRDKTGLVLMDGLRGTYDGPPEQAPQVWDLYAEGTPNTLFFSTDPVTNEYWGRDLINAERGLHGMDPKLANWIEAASGEPYNIGISDPQQMTVIHRDPASQPEAGPFPAAATFFLTSAPNPFRDATVLHFRLAGTSHARLSILDTSGRMVRRLASSEFPAGFARVTWDGRDNRGGIAPGGTYFACLETGGLRRIRRIARIR